MHLLRLGSRISRFRVWDFWGLRGSWGLVSMVIRKVTVRVG